MVNSTAMLAARKPYLLRDKRLNWMKPEVRARHAEIAEWSRLWWPHADQPSADRIDDYGRVLRYSDERTPRNRVCLPLNQVDFLNDVRPLLQEHGIACNYVPIASANEGWYFVDTLDDLNRLLTAIDIHEIETDTAPPDTWRQRLRVPFEIEHFHYHLKPHLDVAGVRSVRVLSEQEGYSVLFFNKVADVQAALHGLIKGVMMFPEFKSGHEFLNL